MKFGKTIDGANKLVTDANNRLASDAEKAAWNSKANGSHTHTSSNITDFVATVRSSILTGLSTATSSVIAATDSILVALGKLQAQINLKANSASPTLTGTVVLPSTTSIGTVTNTEIGYLDGVTSALQTQLNAKAPLASPALTGTPTAPTATVGTNNTQIATTAFVQGAMSSVGSGDMLKSVYDTTGNGIVDNAEKVNGLTVLTAVPLNAKFTDTTYTSLPANGGNSDTIDNKHASDFMSNGLGDVTAGNSVFNFCVAQVTGGSFRIIPGAIDNPTDSWNLGFLTLADTGNRSVIVITQSGRLYSSKYVNTTWTAWRYSGDGGNADLFDGIDSSKFMRSYYNGDIDTSLTTYPIAYTVDVTGLGITYAPSTDWWHILYIPHSYYSAGYGAQIAIGFHGGNTMYVRSAGGTTWGAWRAVADGGNAETVDGKHTWVGALASKGTDANTLYFCY